jgi:succinoglycan biosynthesis transport protein ExoP
MPGADTGNEGDLRHYLRVLRRRKWTVAFASLTVVAAAVVASLLQTPLYASRAEVLLRPDPEEGALADPESRREVARAIPTEIRLLQSNPVRDRVRAKLGFAPTVTVKQVDNTEFLAVRAEHAHAATAAAIANAYAEEYIDYRRDQAVDALVAVSDRLQAQIAADQREIDALTASLAAVRPGEPLTPDQQRQASQRETLQRRVASNEQTLADTQARAEVASGQAQLVRPAAVPDEPFRPTPVRTGLLALGIGLTFGLGLAFLVDYLDDSLKTIDDIGRVARNLPVLGTIPLVPSWKDRRRAVLVSLDDTKSLPSEAYRTVRTSVQFLGLDRPLRTLQVTSAGAHEGKTTTLANLAVTLAHAGQRVVAVCCDLRKPRLHEFFRLPNAIGFTSVLLGDVPLSSALQRVKGVPGLSLLASGPPPPNPSELVGGARAAEVLTALAATFDVVLVDCPPVLPVTDAAALSRRVDATLLVATAGTTTTKALGRAVELLRQVEAPLIGTVLNGVGAESGYGYGYGYGYGEEKPRKRQKDVPAHVRS